MIRFEFEPPKVDGLGEEAMRAAWPLIRQALTECGLLLLNAFRRTVGGSGGGAAYKRTKSGKMHRASVEGAPPARDRGDYVNSFGFEMAETPNSIEVRVGSRLWEKRGQLLEYGTRRMKPRPHVEQAINEALPSINKKLEEL